MLPYVLYQRHQFLPLVRVGGRGHFTYWAGLPQPHLEVFVPEVGVSSVPVLLLPAELHLHLHL